MFLNYVTELIQNVVLILEQENPTLSKYMELVNEPATDSSIYSSIVTKLLSFDVYYLGFMKSCYLTSLTLMHRISALQKSFIV